ncbi:hypothetical protein TNCT_596291 [Trichonephila clavata]|uniref:Uncharacterized protein n=1 Tax=Trichonephila clavata TaxID=2740835 RepID=A0A8X6GMA2_TRICU|nr:hypothetical protein TNCT_596291 [Trichonephila clavata]
MPKNNKNNNKKSAAKVELFGIKSKTNQVRSLNSEMTYFRLRGSGCDGIVKREREKIQSMEYFSQKKSSSMISAFLHPLQRPVHVDDSLLYLTSQPRNQPNVSI